MAFIEHKPSRSRTGRLSDVIDAIRVSFKEKSAKSPLEAKNIILTIYIGKNIADKLDLDAESRVMFFYDDINTRKWLIKKSLTDTGYKLVEATKTGAGSNYLRMQLTFKVPNFTIKDDDLINRKVGYAIENNGILIDAN